MNRVCVATLIGLLIGGGVWAHGLSTSQSFATARQTKPTKPTRTIISAGVTAAHPDDEYSAQIFLAHTVRVDRPIRLWIQWISYGPIAEPGQDLAYPIWSVATGEIRPGIEVHTRDVTHPLLTGLTTPHSNGRVGQSRPYDLTLTHTIEPIEPPGFWLSLTIYLERTEPPGRLERVTPIGVVLEYQM